MFPKLKRLTQYLSEQYTDNWAPIGANLWAKAKNLFDTVCDYTNHLTHPFRRQWAYNQLTSAEMITDVNFDPIYAHKAPVSAASAMIKLQMGNILTTETRDDVLRHETPESLARAMIQLRKANQLSYENVARLLDKADPLMHAKALIIEPRDTNPNAINIKRSQNEFEPGASYSAIFPFLVPSAPELDEDDALVPGYNF